MRTTSLVAALALSLVPGGLSAQDIPAIAPMEAKQCSVWASYVSTQLDDDPQTQQALLFAVNYFVGYFEGATGQSIAESDDTEALMTVANELERYSTICAGHMEAFGSRMTDWGEILTRLGESGLTEE